MANKERISNICHGTVVIKTVKNYYCCTLVAICYRKTKTKTTQTKYENNNKCPSLGQRSLLILSVSHQFFITARGP